MKKTPRTAEIADQIDFPWSYNVEMLVRHAEKMERLLREVYDHGENTDLHGRIGALLGSEE